MSLQDLINLEIPERWTQTRIDEADQQTISEETLGIMISVWSEWDGLSILRVFMSALGDANFHHEAEIIGQMLEAEYLEEQPEFELKVTN